MVLRRLWHLPCSSSHWPQAKGSVLSTDSCGYHDHKQRDRYFQLTVVVIMTTCKGIGTFNWQLWLSWPQAKGSVLSTDSCGYHDHKQRDRYFQLTAVVIMTTSKGIGTFNWQLWLSSHVVSWEAKGCWTSLQFCWSEQGKDGHGFHWWFSAWCCCRLWSLCSCFRPFYCCWW